MLSILMREQEESKGEKKSLHLSANKIHLYFYIEQIRIGSTQRKELSYVL